MLKQDTQVESSGPMSKELVTIDGVSATIPEHARRLGLSRQLLRYRLRQGFTGARLTAAPAEQCRVSSEAVQELRRRVAAGERPALAARALGVSETYGRWIAEGWARRKG
jgi:hypothetical protein